MYKLLILLALFLNALNSFGHGEFELDPAGVSKFVKQGLLIPVKTSNQNERAQPGQEIKLKSGSNYYIMGLSDFSNTLIDALESASKYVAKREGLEIHHDEVEGKLNFIQKTLSSIRTSATVNLPLWSAEFISNRGAIGLGVVLLSWAPYTIVTELVEHGTFAILTAGAATTIPGLGLLCMTFQHLYWSQLDRFLDIFEFRGNLLRMQSRQLSSDERKEALRKINQINRQFQKAWASMLWLDIKQSFSRSGIRAQMDRLRGSNRSKQEQLEVLKEDLGLINRFLHESMMEIAVKINRSLSVWNKMSERFLTKTGNPDHREARLARTQIHVESLEMIISFYAPTLREMVVDGEIHYEQSQALVEYLGQLKKVIRKYKAKLLLLESQRNPDRPKITQLRNKMIALIENFNHFYDLAVEKAENPEHSKRNYIEVPSSDDLKNFENELEGKPSQISTNSAVRIYSPNVDWTPEKPMTRSQINNSQSITELIGELQRYSRLVRSERQKNHATFKILVHRIFSILETMPVELRFQYFAVLSKIVGELEGDFSARNPKEARGLRIVTTGGKFMASLLLARLIDALDDLGKLDTAPLMEFLLHFPKEILMVSTFSVGAAGGSLVASLTEILIKRLRANWTKGGMQAVKIESLASRYSLLTGNSKVQLKSLARSFIHGKIAFLGALIVNKAIWGGYQEGRFWESMAIELATFSGVQFVLKSGQVLYRVMRAGKWSWQAFKASTGIAGIVMMAVELYAFQKIVPYVDDARFKRNEEKDIGELLTQSTKLWERERTIEGQICKNETLEELKMCWLTVEMPLRIMNFMKNLGTHSFYLNFIHETRKEFEIHNRYKNSFWLGKYRVLDSHAFVDNRYIDGLKQSHLQFQNEHVSSLLQSKTEADQMVIQFESSSFSYIERNNAQRLIESASGIGQLNWTTPLSVKEVLSTISYHFRHLEGVNEIESNLFKENLRFLAIQWNQVVESITKDQKALDTPEVVSPSVWDEMSVPQLDIILEQAFETRIVPYRNRFDPNAPGGEQIVEMVRGVFTNTYAIIIPRDQELSQPEILLEVSKIIPTELCQYQILVYKESQVRGILPLIGFKYKIEVN